MDNKKQAPGSRVNNRYPIFPIRLRPDDRETLKRIVDKFELRTLADGIRLAIRVLSELDDRKSVLELLGDYRVKNPDCWDVVIGGGDDK